MFGNAVNEPPWDQVFGVRTIGWWGMTETVSQGIIGDALQRNRPMSTGRPAAGYGIRILRDDLRTPVEPGETGHLQCHGVRGIQIFAEYLNNPQAMQDSFTDDGWFITGDVAIGSPDGYFVIADRTKDLIKSGGEWISSIDVEVMIMQHPQVLEAAVIAVPHPKWVERPLACVVPKPGVTLEPAEIIDFLRDKLARWALPDEVVFIDAVPKTSVGKFDKKVLRERFKDGAPRGTS
jgi:acyl-CoA synthetase (AMP-forming)/AMP-acid ligase II